MVNEKKDEPDFTEYYSKCFDRFYDPQVRKYLKKRGISEETALKFGVGFDPEADPIFAPGGVGEKKYPEPRLIIPVGKSYYVPRAINDASKYPKPNPRGSTVSIFNEEVLYTPGIGQVFAVEGVFDAMSIYQCGYSAIALNSVGQVGHLLERLEEHKTDATLFICLDNDADESARENVKKQLEKLKAGLERLNISYMVVDITGGHKDVNEFLQIDPDGCRKTIAKAVEHSLRPDNVKLYIENRMSEDIKIYQVAVPTGFTKLDADSGGLKIGLYGLPAITSLGKTTFALQIANQAAAAGYHVIFFSLEMSRLELVSKSISQLTMKENGENNGPIKSIWIRNDQISPFVPIGKKGDPLRMAVDRYTEVVGDRLSIVEGNFNCTLSFIERYVQEYMARTGCRPLVIIDYLQILQPEVVNGRKQTTKEVVDLTVTELKRMSRSLAIPIIAISSVNRSNYLTPISFESLKESGSIEFGCDVIWGMQLHCLSEGLFLSDNKSSIVEKRNRIDEAKAANPREIDLVCLKNRFGPTDLTWTYKYYTAYDLFVEI